MESSVCPSLKFKKEVKVMISRSETEIAIIAQFTAKKGKAEDLVAALHQAIGLGLNEPGCRRLILYQSVENPEICTVIEKFADQRAFEAHLAASYTVELLERIIPRLAKKRSITSHKEVLVPQAEKNLTPL
jgi:quinol monooxygenase YgiN